MSKPPFNSSDDKEFSISPKVSHACCDKTLVYLFKWVPKRTVMSSTVWQSDYVRAQPQAERALRCDWISSHHW